MPESEIVLRMLDKYIEALEANEEEKACLSLLSLKVSPLIDRWWMVSDGI